MRPNTPLIIRDAELLHRGRHDVRIENGKIAAVAPKLAARPGEYSIEADGGLLLPGLQDHHLHLYATAAARESLLCGPPVTVDEVALREALLSRDGDGWIRGVGFHDSVCPSLDRHWLDAVCPDRPVRIQHRSGMMWVYNSCALEHIELRLGEQWPDGAERDADGRLSGRFLNLDAWLGEHLQTCHRSLGPLSAELAKYGITGVTDTGVNNNHAACASLRQARSAGELRQRLLIMGNDSLHDIEGRDADNGGIGPLKLYLREMSLPDLDVLVARMRSAHEAERAVAVHCVTRAELHFALLAMEEAGVVPGDRIEHAAVADEHAIEKLAELGVTVVTQPHFIAERGAQYCHDVDADDLPLLYRGSAFLNAGVRLAAGSDAPYGSTDPWLAMRAAVERVNGNGRAMQADERLSPLQAIGLYGGSQHSPGGDMRDIAVGQEADLCLLSQPWEVVSRRFDADWVALTLCGGVNLYQANTLAMRVAS